MAQTGIPAQLIAEDAGAEGTVIPNSGPATEDDNPAYPSRRWYCGLVGSDAGSMRWHRSRSR